MSTKSKLLEIFNDRPSDYISGQELAQLLGISRNSVWKAIKKLQEEGFELESKGGIGYRLLQKGDVLSADYIQSLSQIPCKVHVLEKITSTNDYAKALDCTDQPHIVIAGEQTKGKGRLGRSFYSPASKGLYMSIAFQPEFGLDQSMLITTVSALAVCQALEETAGVSPRIKWVNDIYHQGKKICGILTEAESNFETSHIDKILVGIGVNCFKQVFPEDISQRAGYVANPQKDFNRSELAGSIVKNFFALIKDFDQQKIIRSYKSRSMILGKPILVYGAFASALPENGGLGVKARAIDIDERGGLVVEYMEGRMARQMDTLTGGEVTIREDEFR